MPEYEIAFASRHLRRTFEKAVGRSLLKLLTELVTNSDDSYRRLASGGATGNPPFGEITIEVDRNARATATIDQAEGLTEMQMRDRFVTYGQDSGDRKVGMFTRSLFGKGLRDVLFTQDRSLVESIQEDRAYICKFRWHSKSGGGDHPFVETLAGPRVDSDLRKSWGVIGNGTRVQFKLREGFPFPWYPNLERDLQNFYMLRLILSDPQRRVVLRTKGKDGWTERPLRYTPPAAAATSDLDSRTWKLEFEGHELTLQGYLRALDTEMGQGETPLEEREGGLLVVDEDDAVLDLTLFGYDTDPSAARFFGQLKIDGVGSLIRERLNDDHPEELLTDTRDGFDRKTPFYRVLRDSVDAWLKVFVEEERKRGFVSPKLSESTRKRHEKAFDQLNRLYRRLLGEAVGSGSGGGATTVSTDLPIEFRWARLILKKGASASAQLLVNTSLVAPGGIIAITTSDPNVLATPEREIAVPPARQPNTTAIVGVRLEAVSIGEATIEARVEEASTSLICSVLDEDVPELVQGMAFVPDMLEIRDGERGNLGLYLDLDLVGSIDDLSVSSDNPNIEVEVGGANWKPLTRSVVKGQVTLVAHGKGEEAFITASIAAVNTVAYVRVVTRKTKPRESGGRFKGYVFRSMAEKVQTRTDKDGNVVINLSDPTNRMYFGSDEASATKAVEGRVDSQTLLAELVIDECLQMAVSEAYQRGKLTNRLDPVTDIRNYVSEQRYEIGAEIHRLFVKSS